MSYSTDKARIWNYFTNTADICDSGDQQMELVDALIDAEFPGGPGGVGMVHAKKAQDLKKLARDSAFVRSYSAPCAVGAWRDMSATGEC